jgi:hypothetical protein
MMATTNERKLATLIVQVKIEEFLSTFLEFLEYSSHQSGQEKITHAYHVLRQALHLQIMLDSVIKQSCHWLPLSTCNPRSTDEWEKS